MQMEVFCVVADEWMDEFNWFSGSFSDRFCFFFMFKLSVSLIYHQRTSNRAQQQPSTIIIIKPS